VSFGELRYDDPVMLKMSCVCFVCWFAVCPLQSSQELLPAPPADHGLIYVLDQQNQLMSLPLEKAETPLRPAEIARSTRTSYIELKGEHSATVLAANTRIFLFTIDHGGAHPPLLVWLTPRKGARRVTAIAQKGLKGFAISGEKL
jgi:hypothetical protein